MKYVMLETTIGNDPYKIPVIFPDVLTHADVAQHMKQLLHRKLKASITQVVSAGTYNPIDSTCSGFSETLGVKSQPHDTEVVRMYDYTRGLELSADMQETIQQGLAESMAKRFHEAYERLAPEHGYETREQTAVPWDEVPETNKSLMIAVCRELIG